MSSWILSNRDEDPEEQRMSGPILTKEELEIAELGYDCFLLIVSVQFIDVNIVPELTESSSLCALLLPPGAVIHAYSGSRVVLIAPVDSREDNDEVGAATVLAVQ
ncbi:unnamed protein product [Gongylonema pulchrum]|uniref:Uncharacterized protein n=1 Tax=Gongylonema pulchrum TaxID=637853 RepID=A0A183CY28_9BILA|nr:unnamed protein product [Gongylonema pulchrum]